MLFQSAIEAHNRLRTDNTPLTEAEVRDFFPWMHQLGEPDARVLYGQLALLTMQALHENRAAIERFEKSSSKWTGWLTGLTIVLVVLTLAITWLSWKMV